MKNKIKLAALLLGSSMVLAGCQTFTPNWPYEEVDAESIEIDTPWVDYEVPVTAITFGKDDKNLSLNKGEEHEYEYTIQPKTALKSAVSWESENITVATVENGKVKAVGGGTTTIIASCGSVSARSKVTVNVPISDFTLPDANLDMDWEDTYQINPVFEPADTTQTKMSYTSNNPQAVSVSETGLLEAHPVQGEQSALIQVTNEAINTVRTISVTVSDKYNYIDTFALSAESSEVEVGKSLQVVAEATGIDSSKDPSTNQQVQFSLREEDADKAEIDANGVITAKESGDIKVKATLAEDRGTTVKEAELNLSVFEVTASAISLGEDSKATLELDNGDKTSHQLEWTYTLSRAGFDKPSRSGLKFVSSASNVAKVSDSGLIEVVGLGSAKISVFDDVQNVEDYVNVNTTISAKSLQISKSGELYIDEELVITATTSPAVVSDPIVWTVTQDDAYSTYVEDANKITLTGVKEGTVKVKAECGSLESNEIELNVTERAMDFESGKVYLVGNRNYKTGTSKGEVSSWNEAKYSYVFKEKTGNISALYEYKGIVTFEENDEWLIRDGQTWTHPHEYAGEGEAKHQIGEYKINEGAFKLGQMVVGTDPDGNEKVVVKQAGKYDIYYAFYMDANSPVEGWFSVYVEEHGMKVDKNEVHVNVGEKAYIEVSNYDQVPTLTNNFEDKFTATFSTATNKIEFTGVEAVSDAKLIINDGVKDLEIKVVVKDSAPAGDPVIYYIRGTAANGWDLDEAYRLREGTEEQYGVLLDVYLREGDFKIANADWSEEWGWDYDSHSTIIGGAAANFCAGADSNNIHCSVEGYYDIYFMKNNYISIESEGAPIIPTFEEGYYLRGTMNGWALDNAYKLAESSDPNNHGELINFHLDADTQFKISDNKSDWSGYSIGWSYKNSDELVDHQVIQGSAAANFENADGNIKVKVAGDYDLYLTTNNYIYVNEHGYVPPEPTPTYTDYYVRGDAALGWDASDCTNDVRLVVSSSADNIGEIEGIHLSVGDFKIATSDWSGSQWGWDYDSHDTIAGDAAANFEEGASDNNIHCKVAGTYNLYLTTSNYIYVVFVSPEPEPFAIDKTSASGVVGGTVVITASNYGTAISAQTSDADLATVSVTGAQVTVSLHAAGDVIITVKDDQDTPLTCTIHINSVAPVVSGVAITEESQELSRSSTLQLHATVSGTNVSQDVTWSSSAVGCCTVSNSGLVTAVGGGSAVITATSVDDNTKSADITITVPVNRSRVYIETKSWFNSGDPNEDVMVYAFNSSNTDEHNAEFPGESATYVKDLADGKKIFYYDLDTYYDTFVISKTVNGEKTSQTADIEYSDMGTDNCVYLVSDTFVADNAEVGFYTYSTALALSSTAGTITKGGNVTVTADNVTGTLAYTVTSGTASVSINGNEATISSNDVGTAVIRFTDGSSNYVDYTLTVEEASSARRIYFETKSWFNSGDSKERVMVYAWEDGASPENKNAEFPGLEATYLCDGTDGKKIFYYDLPTGSTYTHLIFSKTVDGTKTSQTVNIEISGLGTDNCIYLVSDSYVAENAAVGHYTYVPA